MVSPMIAHGKVQLNLPRLCTVARVTGVIIANDCFETHNAYTNYRGPTPFGEIMALPLRARLRPLLFLLVFFFLLVPLTVYNLFTFDFQASLERSAFRARPPVHVPPCMAVDSADLLQPGAASSLQARCGASRSAKASNNLRLVHFVHVAQDAVSGGPGLDDKEQFTYLQFAALQSARRALRPDVMMMHYLEAPRGVWYTQCQRHLGLHQVLPPVDFAAGPADLTRPRRRRILEVLIMLRTLRKHGGVAFTDFNTFLLRQTAVGLDADLLVAGQAAGKSFGLGLHVLQAPVGHPLLQFLELEIIKMVEQKDPRLHQMELETLVGQMLLDKYKEGNAASSTTETGSILDGVVVGAPDLFGFDGLHELLTEKVGPALSGRFRGVAGFHVDRLDMSGETDATDDLRELARMQKELTLADEWQSLDTLLGAVVRLAVAANSTAELEPLLA